MRLAAIIFAIAGPTLAAIFILAHPSIDMSAGKTAIAGAAAAGFAIAVPVAIMVARRLGTRTWATAGRGPRMTPPHRPGAAQLVPNTRAKIVSTCLVW